LPLETQSTPVWSTFLKVRLEQPGITPESLDQKAEIASQHAFWHGDKNGAAL
jgi:hypothetical protein